MSPERFVKGESERTKNCRPIGMTTQENCAGPFVSKLESSRFGLTGGGPAFDWECQLRAVSSYSHRW
jgi:hypothetical protein